MTLHHPEGVSLEEERCLHEGRVFRLVHQRIVLPSGLRQSLDLVEHGGAVGIVVRDDAGRMLVVRQYRAAAGAWTLEIPAGRLEAGEDPAATALRELEEETGLRAKAVAPLRRFLPAPGFCSEVIHLFEAQGVAPVPGGGLACDDDEELEVEWRAPAELLAQDPGDAKTLLAALYVMGQGATPAT